MSSVCELPGTTSLVVSAGTVLRQEAVCAAHLLGPQQRIELALASLADDASVSALARREGVSRKFIYQQQRKALLALDDAFSPPQPAPQPPAEEVLFYLPVTKTWLRQFVLALLLICHSSIRGVHELLRDLFDYRLSVGSIHNITREAIAKAKEINACEDLSRVDCAAPDEIFLSGSPILSVVDARSTYCCLLSLEEHRDGDTWGVRYLDLKERGLDMRLAVADMGQGQRSGLLQAYPDVKCRADVFHPERDMGNLARFLENRAYAALKAQVRLEQESSKQPSDKGAGQGQTLARSEADRACVLADDVRTLACWLCRDVLCLSGPPLAERRKLLEFVIVELKERQEQHPQRLGKMWRSLENQKEELLLFVAELDRDITDLARHQGLPEEAVRKMADMQEAPETCGKHWRLQGELRSLLGERYQELWELVKELRKSVVRASSVVENLNSRLRNYFFLRKEVGGGYLDLLRFFLNHRRFLRSEHQERAGHSPKELLAGQEHPHWLEMLGFRLFKRAAA
jgi:hypothetical protein